MVVEHHEIHLQPAPAPEGVHLDEGAEPIEVVHRRDPEQQDREVARDPVGPEPGLRADVSLADVGGRGQPGVAVEQPPGQFLGRERLLPAQPEVAQLDQPVGRGEVEGALRGVGVVVALGQPLGLLACVGHGDGEHDLGALLGLQRHHAPQRHDGVQNSAGSPGEPGAGVHRRRTVQRPPAPDEPHPVGLELELGARRAVRPSEPLVGDGVDQPAAHVVLSARAARGQDGVVLGQVLRLDEQLGEGRVTEVAGGRLEHDLGVAREFDGPGPVGVVRDRDPAHLDVVLGGDDGLGERLDPVVHPGHLDLVEVEPHVVSVGRHGGGHRLACGRPVPPGLHVADVDEQAVGVARAVAVPPRQRHVVEAGVPGPGRREQDGVAAVREQPPVGNRPVRRAAPEVLDAGLDGDHLDGLHLGVFQRVWVDFFHDGRDALLEEDFDGPNERVSVEPLLESAALKNVRQRQKSHALVVGHVALNHVARLALVHGRDASRRVVDGLVVAVWPPGPGLV